MLLTLWHIFWWSIQAPASAAALLLMYCAQFTFLLGLSCVPRAEEGTNSHHSFAENLASCKLNANITRTRMQI